MYQRESSPIRSPVRGKSPGKSERSPAKTSASDKSTDFNLKLLSSPLKGKIYHNL